MRVIIIGGGAAGASCATRLRRLNEDAEIIILERTSEVSIANCGLPYYISDVIPNRDSILVSTPQKFKSWFNIDVRLETEVVEINKEEKYVITSFNGKLSYDYLVLANGASPIIPDLVGLNLEKTFVVRTLNDAEKIANGETEEEQGGEVASTPEDFYKNNSCIGCHGGSYEGGAGPALTGVGERLSPEEIKDVLKNGKGIMQGGLVPEDQLDAVTEWLSTL